MFLRVKKIRKKGREYRYAYAVENVWRKRKKATKQKVRKYLGRVYTAGKEDSRDFFEHYGIMDVDKYLRKSSRAKIVDDLVMVELINHGFKEYGEYLVKESICFNTKNNHFFINNSYNQNNKLSIKDINKDIINDNADNLKKIKNDANAKDKIVLEINDGFLCSETISRLIHGYFEGSSKEVGYKLAKAFVEAGLKVPKEVFVEFFKKVLE